MKEKLPEDEYKKRYMHREYEKRKEQYKEKYEKKKEEATKELKELCDEIWPGNDLTDWDKFYADKFKLDDTWKKWHSYRFAWWSSKLARLKWERIPKQTKPFRIMNRNWMTQLLDKWIDIQHRTYEYLNPLMWELWDSWLFMGKKQQPYKYPLYLSDDKLKAVANNAPVNAAYVYLLFDALRRDKYIFSEMYLWRTSFIFWDVLVTQTWNLFRISLENNLPWLTKDTVESIHESRMKWHKRKKKEALVKQPPIYIVNDAYLIKVSLKWEVLYYIVPT